MTRIAVESGGGGGGHHAPVSVSDRALHLTRKSEVSRQGLKPGKKSFLKIRAQLKEERKKVLKTSVRKLKNIDDPETFLCRSVLINNTMKRLQHEIRSEREAKRAGIADYHYQTCNNYNSYGHLPHMTDRSLDDHFSNANGFRNNDINEDDFDDDTSSSDSSSSSSDNYSSEDDLGELDEQLEQTEVKSQDADTMQNEEQDEEDNSDDLKSASSLMRSQRSTGDSHKRVNEDLDLLREVYMPPSPPSLQPVSEPVPGLDGVDSATDSALWNELDSSRSNNWTPSISTWSDSITFAHDKVDHGLSLTSPSTPSVSGSADSAKHYSCGQTSMMGELQSVVFNSLIASLET